MDNFISGIFYREIERQCKFALIASEDIQKSLMSNFNDKDRLWYSLQTFLIAVGNISKILWPPNKKYTNRGQDLLQKIGIDDNSFIKTRDFRNYFEHFDERLEDWARQSKSRNFVDSNIGSITNAITGIDPKDFIRNFDPNTFELTFRGDLYQLNPVINEIKEIMKAMAMSRPTVKT